MQQQIENYLKNKDFVIPEDLKKQKLNDITAASFASHVVDFYQDAAKSLQK